LVFIAGNETCYLGRAAFDSPAVRRENRNQRPLATGDVHGVVDTFDVVLREIVKTPESF